MSQNHIRALEKMASDAGWDASHIEAIIWASREALTGATGANDDLERISRVTFLLAMAQEKVADLVERLDTQPKDIANDFGESGSDTMDTH